MTRRVSEWVSGEMAKVPQHGDEFAWDLSRRSRKEIGTEVPVGTIKAHVFAIQKQLAKAATEVGNG